MRTDGKRGNWAFFFFLSFSPTLTDFYAGVQEKQEFALSDWPEDSRGSKLHGILDQNLLRKSATFPHDSQEIVLHDQGSIDSLAHTCLNREVDEGQRRYKTCAIFQPDGLLCETGDLIEV